MITTTQKIIKIGSSNGVSLPARELKNAGLTTGDEVEITVKQVRSRVLKHEKLIEDYEQFKSLYGDALKSLAGR